MMRRGTRDSIEKEVYGGVVAAALSCCAGWDGERDARAERRHCVPNPTMRNGHGRIANTRVNRRQQLGSSQFRPLPFPKGVAQESDKLGGLRACVGGAAWTPGPSQFSVQKKTTAALVGRRIAVSWGSIRFCRLGKGSGALEDDARGRWPCGCARRTGHHSYLRRSSAIVSAPTNGGYSSSLSVWPSRGRHI